MKNIKKHAILGTTILLLILTVSFLPAVEATGFWWDNVKQENEYNPYWYPHPDRNCYGISPAVSGGVSGTTLIHYQVDMLTTTLVFQYASAVCGLIGATICDPIGSLICDALGFFIDFAGIVLVDGFGCMWFWLSNSFCSWVNQYAAQLWQIGLQNPGYAAAIIVWALNEFGYIRVGPITFLDSIGMGDPCGQPTPQLIKNGGFESGSSYWTLAGDGNHRIVSGNQHSGSYSLFLGHYFTAPIADSRDSAYQMITIPPGAEIAYLSFWYRLATEDSVTYDWFDVYVAPVGGYPALMFKKGGASRGVWEYYGWSQVSIDISAYAGQSIYIYFSVFNGYDNHYFTYCNIDDVTVNYI